MVLYLAHVQKSHVLASCLLQLACESEPGLSSLSVVMEIGGVFYEFESGECWLMVVF